MTFWFFLQYTKFLSEQSLFPLTKMAAMAMSYDGHMTCMIKQGVLGEGEETPIFHMYNVVSLLRIVPLQLKWFSRNKPIKRI